MVAKLRIDGVIGDGLVNFWTDEVPKCFTATMMAEFIEANKNADEFEITISSDGGSVRQGYEIFDLLAVEKQARGVKVTTIGFNVCSIATVIFLAGDVRKLSSNADFWPHNPWLGGENLMGLQLRSEDFADLSEEMKKEEVDLQNFYGEQLDLGTRKKAELIRDMEQDHNIGAEKAKYYGFATEIIGDEAKVKKVKALAYSDSLVMALQNSEVGLNKQLNKIVKMADNKEKKSGLNAIIAQARAALKKFKLDAKAAVAKFVDGREIFYEGEEGTELKVGDKVYINHEMTDWVEEGEHTLENGEVIVIDGEGTVTEIRATDGSSDDETELFAENQALKAEVAELKTKLSASQKRVTSLQAERVEMGKDFQALVAELTKSQGSKPVVQNFKKEDVENNADPYAGLKRK